MKAYEVKFNTQEIVVKDNSQVMFKRSYMNKNYITKTSKKSFMMSMIAKNFKDCLTKARQFYKDASSIEVKEIKQATTSINLLNNNKQVA